VIQDKLSKVQLFIVVADIKGLYLNVKKHIVKCALSTGKTF